MSYYTHILAHSSIHDGLRAHRARRSLERCAIIAACVRASTPSCFPSEIGDFADEVRQVFLELGRAFGAESLAGECSPAARRLRNRRALEIAVDLPGVDPAAVRVVSKATAC